MCRKANITRNRIETARRAKGACVSLENREGCSSRCLVLAEYIAASRDTVRGAAAKFGISKSTVHHDITVRLQEQNRGLYQQVQEVLQQNKKERHIRGGAATRRKYELLRREKGNCEI